MPARDRGRRRRRRGGARARSGARPTSSTSQQFCCGGLNFGYFYDRSPIIAYDGEAAPAYTMGRFTPSTVPGCRAPHFWLRDGRSLYDALGPGYTLLRFDPALDVAPLLAAAAQRGVPLALLDVGRRGGGRRSTGSARALAAGPARRLARRCAAGRPAGAHRPGAGRGMRGDAPRPAAGADRRAGPGPGGLARPPPPHHRPLPTRRRHRPAGAAGGGCALGLVAPAGAGGEPGRRRDGGRRPRRRRRGAGRIHPAARHQHHAGGKPCAAPRPALRPRAGLRARWRCWPPCPSCWSSARRTGRPTSPPSWRRRGRGPARWPMARPGPARRTIWGWSCWPAWPGSG